MIAQRLKTILERIQDACTRAHRDPEDVTLIAVSKLHPASAVREAWAAGLWDFGENYAQELVAKQADCADLPVAWHFIGRLQRNKARLIAGKVALIHAVDSVELALEIGRRAGAAVQPILLAVNLAGEASKGGVTAEAAPAIAAALAGIAGVALDGLMTMPPPADDADASRPHFAALAAMRDRLADRLGRALPVLSMGMSHDFEVAIACGATHVRIGTAIFGSRAAPAP